MRAEFLGGVKERGQGFSEVGGIIFCYVRKEWGQDFLYTQRVVAGH